MSSQQRNARAAAGAELARQIAPYMAADNCQGLQQVALSLLAFVGLWVLAYHALQLSYGLTLLLALPAAGFL